MSLSSKDPMIVKAKAKNAIARDERPADLLYSFLSSGTKEANLIANYLISYRDTILVLTSLEGRQFLHRWLDDTLNYLEKYARDAQ